MVSSGGLVRIEDAALKQKIAGAFAALGRRWRQSMN